MKKLLLFLGIAVLCPILNHVLSQADDSLETVKAALTKQGASFRVDSNLPDKPIVHVSLKGKLANDKTIDDLKKLTKLNSLAFAGTLVTDKGFAALAALTELRDLDLSDSLISDEGLKSLLWLSKLEKLNLNKTQIHDGG